MPKYKINEIFYSLQGEGIRAGTANVFVRFAHCNLTCNFCDTQFESSVDMTDEQIAREVLKFNCQNVIFTGGEPALQLDISLIRTLRTSLGEGGVFAIETNGSVKISEDIYSQLFITVSPKVSEHVLKQNFQGRKVNELKYVINSSQLIPRPSLQADYYFLSPMNQGNLFNLENLNHCIQLIKENPQWRLTTQQHKFWNVP
jgi:organic radical activating enzyme